MYVSDCISVNERGHLTIGSYDSTELIKQFGSPLYAFDENEIRKNLRSFKKSIDDDYNGYGQVIYASKAFCCKEMIRICREENCGVDVVSGGELYTAISVGFPMEDIVFHGNNKTYDELVMAVDNNVGRIVVDNLTELETLNKIAAEKGKTAGIMLRIKPGIDAPSMPCCALSPVLTPIPIHLSKQVRLTPNSDLLLKQGKRLTVLKKHLV